jgi:hypothetical protein
MISNGHASAVINTDDEGWTREGEMLKQNVKMTLVIHNLFSANARAMPWQ